MQENIITFICPVCLEMIEAKILKHHKHPDIDIVQGLICDSCYIKRRSKDRLNELGFSV